MRHYLFFLAGLFLFLLAAASSLRAGYPAQMTTSSPFVNLPRPQDDRRWSEALAHWDRRDDTKELLAAIAVFEALAKDHPNQIAPQLYLLRADYVAGIRGRDADRLAWMKKSLAAGDRALKLDPQNEQARYWRYSSLFQVREFTAAEFQEIRTFGARYENLRELPVPADDPLWAEAIAHWDRRLTRAEGLAAIASFSKLARKYPQRIEPKLWLCRSNYWMHYLESGNEAKAKWLFAAADWGRQALRLEPRNHAANYWTAASLGQYGTYTSFTNYVRYSMDIFRELSVVMEEDPIYFYGGVSQYLAIAMARAGSVAAKILSLMGYSAESLEKFTNFGASFEPRYLRNYLALAELYLSQGRRPEAKKMLETVIKADPAALRLQEPENRIAQQLARDLLNQHFSR